MNAVKLKHIANHISRGNPPDYVEKSQIQVVNQSCVYPNNLDFSKVKFNNSENIDKIDSWIRKDDILINSTGTGTLGRVAFVREEPELPSFADGHVTILRDSYKRFHPKFIFHYLSFQQEHLTALCAVGSTNQIELSRAKFGDLEFNFPSLSQQYQIADYLDRETQKIDALIAAQKRLLELLGEKRRSLITHAVTRGLKADVPMKDSGIEWLGEIPKHWSALQLKQLCKSLQTGPFGSQLHAEDYVDGGIPSINPAHLSNGQIVPDKKVAVDEETAERLSIHRLQVGDVVFARRGEVGRCGLVTEKEVGWLCGSGSLRARPRKDILNPEYLIRIMLNTFASKWLSLMSVGTTMDNLNMEIIGSLSIPLPPLEEQKKICEELSIKIMSFDQLSEITQNAIALLQERRTSLISAAVTGQHPIPD